MHLGHERIEQLAMPPLRLREEVLAGPGGVARVVVPGLEVPGHLAGDQRAGGASERGVVEPLRHVADDRAEIVVGDRLQRCLEVVRIVRGGGARPCHGRQPGPRGGNGQDAACADDGRPHPPRHFERSVDHGHD